MKEYLKYDEKLEIIDMIRKNCIVEEVGSKVAYVAPFISVIRKVVIEWYYSNDEKRKDIRNMSTKQLIDVYDKNHNKIENNFQLIPISEIEILKEMENLNTEAILKIYEYRNDNSNVFMDMLINDSGLGDKFLDALGVNGKENLSIFSKRKI